MAKRVVEQIKELQDAKNKKSKLEAGIRKCDNGIALLSHTSRNTKGSPWVIISVNDNYTDDDYWMSAEIRLTDLSPELTEIFVEFFETKKRKLQKELDDLKMQYYF